MALVENVPEVPYVKEKLSYETVEAGPVNSENLSSLLKTLPNSPRFSSTTCIDLRFVVDQGALLGSHAQLFVGTAPNEPVLGLEDVYVPHAQEISRVGNLLQGGKIEQLNLEYPYKKPWGYTASVIDKRKHFLRGGAVLDALGTRHLGFLEEMGYHVDPSSFKLYHYMIEVPYYGPMSARGYGAKVQVFTQTLIKDKSDKKLALRFTPDLEASREVQWYKEFLNLQG